jgi:hypothetical protein
MNTISGGSSVRRGYKATLGMTFGSKNLKNKPSLPSPSRIRVRISFRRIYRSPAVIATSSRLLLMSDSLQQPHTVLSGDL